MIQEVKTSYGKTKIYRSAPPASDKRVLIIPGYSASITHNSELMNSLARKGYDAFTFDQPRRSAFIDPIARQQAIVLEILDATLSPGQKVYVVTHSFGAAAALGAAKKNPERFSGLLLMQPSGIGDEQTFVQLLSRVGRKTVNNHVDPTKHNPSAKDTETIPIPLGQVLRYHAASIALIARNPLLALREAIAAIEHSISDDIIAVQKLGIPVNIVVVRNDELFSMKNFLEYENVMELSGSYSSLVNNAARHDTFWMHPEQTAGLVEGFIKQIPRM